LTIKLTQDVRLIIMLTCIMGLSVNHGFSQRRGFTDDFEDGTLEFTRQFGQSNRPPVKIWGTVTPGTYGLSEADGVPKIDY